MLMGESVRTIHYLPHASEISLDVHRTAVVQVDHMDSKAPGRGLRSSPGNQVYAMDSLGEDKFIVGEDGESFNSNAHSGLKGNVGRLV